MVFGIAKYRISAAITVNATVRFAMTMAQFAVTAITTAAGIGIEILTYQDVHGLSNISAPFSYFSHFFRPTEYSD